MVNPRGNNTKSVLFSVTVKKYKHVEHCVSLVWHWSMCSGKFGQPAASPFYTYRVDPEFPHHSTNLNIIVGARIYNLTDNPPSERDETVTGA